MIQAQALVALFRRAHQEGWGYIWGARGETWTAKKQAAATRDMTVKYGAQWVGRKVADCSGLFVWAYGELGYSIYHGSNTIFRKHCSVTGRLKNGKRADGAVLRPGTAVFQHDGSRYHHIGLYIGDGAVIEAHGTRAGVIVSEVSGWHSFGELKQVVYEGSTETMTENITLRKGDKGEAVGRLQTLLLAAGYPLPKHGADGDFGKETEAAVRQYQTTNGLTVDGVCGAQMWGALTELDADDPPEGDIEADFDVLLDALKALVARYAKYDKQ